MSDKCVLNLQILVSSLNPWVGLRLPVLIINHLCFCHSIWQLANYIPVCLFD